MKMAFFVSSLVSSYWNGAATYYRGLARALHERGHALTFYEPDALGRQSHRDLASPDYARSVVWDPASPGDLERCLEEAGRADLVVKASGIGVDDALLEARVLTLRRADNRVAFWDVDAPATLESLELDPGAAFRALVPRYDLVFTYGGGAPVVRAYRGLGARACVPIYNALDPSTHHAVPPEDRLTADLAFLGNRLPDREERVKAFFLSAATRLPERSFLLGGAGWGDAPLPPNVRWLGHVPTRDHNALNCSARAVLNVNRDSMARVGFSPPTRVFEAAGAGACLVSDAWDGIEAFLEPGSEVLLARDGEEVAWHLAALTPARARRLGEAARRRVLAHHTYAHRAREVEVALGDGAAAEVVA
ncbi:MAG TPA: glycosyltransferase [Anaeromyxobacteraceae bacterium]|jgi:spore maturation protein CgeB|nr:glycosyltransferase [Anaeromyxobacteraceae bacterium]